MRRPCMSLLAVAVVASALTLGATATAPAASAATTDLRINEVESNGGTPVDWIELTNVGTDPVDASGLRLKDNDDSRTFAVPPGTVVQPGGFVAVDVDVTGGFGLGAADSARLYQADGTTLIDSYGWTAHAATTYGRCPDGTGGFRTTTASTKGVANNCLPSLRINEIESADASGGTDWVEVVNVGTEAVDAGGLLLKDDGDASTVTIPAGTTIAAGALAAFDVTGLDAADSARLLSGAAVLDSYAWTTHASTTYGRCPNPAGSFTTTTRPTKGAANDCGALVTQGIVFNEIESNADPIGDFAELVNTTTSPIDLSGYQFTDSEPERVGHVYTFPTGTVVAPGAYYVVAESAFGFGLGAPDAVRLVAPDGTTVVDSYAWTQHAVITYGRCPDKTGPVVTTSSSTRGAANDCRPPVRINEIESDGGTPGDWVELVNPGTTTVDLSGFVLRDNMDTSTYAIPAGTSLAPGGYLVIENPTQFSFGLGSADSARLFATDGTTLVDSFTWTAHATTTYGRCPDGTGDFATTQQPTKGAANLCPGDLVVGPWPGGADVTTVDPQGTFPSNLSGLVYQGSGSQATGTLYAVRNGPGALFTLRETGGVWAPVGGDWAAGKLLRYTDGTGDVDAEGVTFTAAGPDAGVFVASERNNAANTVSRPAILRYLPETAGTSLTATTEWNLTPDLPGLGPNLGLEAIAWVPDPYLVGRGLVDETTTAAYDPTRYANHGGGLFLVGVEQTGRVYAYALDLASGGYTRVASFASGFPSVMELTWEPETQQLWVVCDDTCQGRSSVFAVGGSGAFAPVEYYERPAGMPNLNNEGFAITPRAECVAGRKPVFWSDDSGTGGYALRRGTLRCTERAAQTVTFTSTPPTSPVVGQTWTVAADGSPTGNPVTFASVTPSTCTVSGDTVTAVAPGACVVQATQAGSQDATPGQASQGLTVAKARALAEATVTPESLRATITVAAPGAATTSGTVTFLLDGAVAGTADVVDGVATLAYVVPAGRRRSVVAAYSGSALLTAADDTVQRDDPVVSVQVDPTRPASGWWRTPVTVAFTCETTTAPLAGSCPDPVVLDRSGADQVVTRTVTAQDGGSTTAVVDDLDVDLDDPGVRVAGVEAGRTYPLDEPDPRCVASDATSGVARCTVRTEADGLVRIVTATATDVAGNTATSTARYRVPVARVVDAVRVVDGRYVVRRDEPFTVAALLDGRPVPELTGPVRQAAGAPASGPRMRVAGSPGGLTVWRGHARVTGSGEAWKVVVRVGERRVVVPLTVR